MPDPTPDEARRYAKIVGDLYAEATTAILRSIADRMARGLDDSAQRDKLGDLLTLRRNAQDVAEATALTLDATLVDTIRDAYSHGVGQGSAHLSALLGLRDLDAERAASRALVGTKRSTVEALARNLAGTLSALPITRSAEDAYRRATLAAVVPATAGVEVRRNATQRALDRLAMEGVGSFTDKGGRRWRIESYAEMATRTTVAQAALTGTVDRIAQTTPFVRVSDVADECELCRPFEGAILLAGSVSDIPEKWADVSYDGTLRDATSRGLFHPNCTHSLGAYIPGLTRDRAERGVRANPQGYADRQRQRALERHVREWKRREAVAITPDAKRLAAGKVQRWQQELAEHVERTNRLRRYDRESIRRRRLPDDGGAPTPDTIDPTSGPDAPGSSDVTIDVPDPDPLPEALDPRDLDDDALDAQVADLMAAQDYGPRFEALSAELDRRDAERNQPLGTVPDHPDPVAEQGVLRNAWGDDVTAMRAAAKADKEYAEQHGGQHRVMSAKELRDEYDTWAHTQWLRAEEETRGNLLNKAGIRDGVDPLRFFNGNAKPATIRKYATEELLRWFAERPENARQSFDEFRAVVAGGKAARKARDRASSRTLSEFG